MPGQPEPDMLGFGKSDKPVDNLEYTYHFHREMLTQFIRALNLYNIILVCQDWGGILGLSLPLSMPLRFAPKAIIMNTTLTTGNGATPKGFVSWRAYCKSQPNLKIAPLMLRACPNITQEDAAAYDAPFPSIEYKSGCQALPRSCPNLP
eukprot:TRINITY_DN348_c0_g1_i3.p1 TRINITY_DN348_c0_g1~~TRINITY_DN348_c0_g1_i3.p1  ORF type:complete len:149 (+),score=11.88 TRINITY_DN348_c0_g1_i3:176-622(+)